MNAKKYIFKCMYNLRLWLLAVLFIGMHGFIQGQNTITVTFDNPIPSPGVTSSGTNNSNDENWGLTLPAGSTNIIGQAYGGGGGGGGTSAGGGHAFGGGGGGYISYPFGNGSGSISGQIGGGGARGAKDNNADAGGDSYITFNTTTIIAYGGGGGGKKGSNITGIGGTTSQNLGSTYANGTNGGGDGGGRGGGGGRNNGPNGGAGAPTPDLGWLVQYRGYNGYNPGGGGASGYGTNEPGGHGGGGRVIISFSIPAPVITTVSATTLCSGNTLTLKISDATFSSGVTYSWYREETLIQKSTSQTLTISNLTSSNTGNYSVIANYAIAYTGGIIPSASIGTVSGGNILINVTSTPTYVTVNTTPAITNKTITVCSGEIFAVTPSNTSPDVVPSGTTYSWSIPSAPSGVSGVNSGTNLGYIGGTTLTNTTSTAQEVTYVVTPKYLTCEGTPFNVVVTINPKPIIPNSTTFICSGENVNYIPTTGTIPAGTTYEWELSTVTPAEYITSLPQNGSGSSINLGTLTNILSSNAVAVYNVTPTAQGCQGAKFTFTVNVFNLPQIMATNPFICSGDTLHLWLNNPMSGTYSSSDPSIAYVNPSNGILYTDVELVDGIPELRPPHSANEGKGDTVTITFTTANGCVATKNVTVIPRKKTPHIRWDYKGVCPIDEGESSYTKADSANILTPWNPGGVYFANYIVWDSLIVTNEHQDIDLNYIRWYADEALTQPIRSGLDPLPDDGRMANFWQNEPHPKEVYWATVMALDSCESRPIRVEVYIRETPEEVDIDDLIGYVQPAGTPLLDLSDYLELNLDDSQDLEWYATEVDAVNAENEIGEPPALDLTQIINKTYWIVKADDFGCRSLPTPFHIELFDMPEISIEADKDLVCPGTQVAVAVDISGGTAPYSFKVKNMNSGAIDEQTGINSVDLPYSFNVNPLSSVVYRIIHFSDGNTNRVNYPTPLPDGLKIPAIGYFDEAVLSVVVTEITGINPNSGPTTGGTYTTNPNDPIALTGKVTISGSGFAPLGLGAVWLVTFGGVDATKIKVIDNNTLTCIPPPHVSGYVTVAVTTACATVTLTDGYRYEPINIAEVEPAYAPVTGKTTIIIRGTGLLASVESGNLVTVTLAGVPASIESVSNTEIVCIANQSEFSLLGSIIINNGSEIREFPKSFTYYPVNFIENGKWSEPHRWETQTSDHILPYPGAVIQINANCLQDTTVYMDSITVHPSKAYTLDENVVLEANVFTLKENASFLDYNTGNANMKAIQQNVEHVLTKDRNWYISNPVSDPDSLTANNDRIEWYNETTKVWESTTSLNVGQGYTIYSLSADMDVKFSGQYNDGDKTSQQLTRTNDNGFNLVGNPFPSYWHWTESTANAAGLYSTIWYRTVAGGIYEFWSYNASGNVTVAPTWEESTPTGSYSLGYIPPMQAFWVRVKDGFSGGTLTFADDRRTHADHGSNVLKSTEINTENRPLLRISATDNRSTDEIVIYADPNAKKDFDSYDSDKWFSNQGVEIFTTPVFSTRELVINGLPEIVDGTEIPLGFQANEGGIFSFRAKEILNLDALDVFLIDKWRNTEFDLRSGDYKFSSSSISGTDRFCIVFRTFASTDLSDIESGSDNLIAHVNESGQIVVLLNLLNKQGNNARISIFDVMGRKLTEQSIVVGEQTTLHGSFSEGIYILQVEKYSVKVGIFGK